MEKEKTNNSNGVAIFLAAIVISLSILLSSFSNFDLPFDGILRNNQGDSLVNHHDQIQTSIAMNELGYDAWGRPKTVQDFSLFHGVWTYDIPKTMWIVKDNGIENLNTSSLVVSTNGMLEVKSGGHIESRRHPRYQPNRGLLYSNSIFLPNPNATGLREFGLFTEEAGYFYRLVNGTLYGVIRTTNNGITTETELLINTTGINLEKGNIFDIQAQWRGVGDVEFFINLEEKYEYYVLGTLNELSVSNPALPIAFKTTYGSNSIFSGCVDLTSEGGLKENRQYNSLTSGEQSLTTGETALLVMRINESYHGKINTRDLSLRRITGYADANTIMRIYYTRDSNAIIGGTWINNNGGNTQYQILPTFNQTDFTKSLVSSRIPANGDYSADNPDDAAGDFYLVRGDYIIITLEAKSNTNGGITIEWGEEI